MAIVSVSDIMVSSSEEYRSQLVDYRLDDIWQSQATHNQWAMLNLRTFISVLTVRLFFPNKDGEFFYLLCQS